VSDHPVPVPMTQPSACSCRHHQLIAPDTRQEALRLAYVWARLRPALELTASDPARWLAVFRCGRCGQYWAEDSIESGHAEQFFGYPIVTRDPYRWLGSATRLTLRR
jgi:hypothetical protein